MTQELILSVVVPILNEEERLWGNLSEVANMLDTTIGKRKWKFILVDNGSTDTTPMIIERITRQWPPSYSIYEVKQNYGAALRVGLSRVDTTWAHTIDVDQWDIPFLKWAWKRRYEYDVFIASKRADPTICHQPTYRKFLSWGLNALLQLFFSYTGSDTHGPKLLNIDKLRPILDKCFLDRGQYDTEIVLRAVRAGLRLVELPVTHKEIRRPRNLLLKKILWNLVAFNRLRKVLRDVPFEGPVRLRRFTREDVLNDIDVT